MSIHIGNNNTIKNSTIAENIKNQKQKPNFYEKHPIVCGIIVALIPGFILMFKFWNNIVAWIEGWF